VLGRVTTRTDANGKITAYGYDSLGRLTSVTQDAVVGGLNLLTQYTYDEVGNRLTQTDANNHTTQYAYDQRGRRIGRALPAGQVETYAYDASGNLSSRTDFNGRTTAYTYDTVNRILSKAADPYFVTNHIGAASESFTYTATGKRATMVDASGTTTYTYDTRDRVTSKATPEGTLSYSYDAASDVKTIQSSNTGGASMAYGYDALDRLSTVTDANGATSYTYDPVGNLGTVTYPNGVAHSYTYDTRNRLTNLGVTGTVNGATAIASYGYTLDAAGHRTSVTELSGRKVNYGYDTIYRLTNETIASDPNSMNGAVSYSYDAVGNRLQKTSTLPGFPGASSTYNANDELTTDAYDNDGNTIGSGLNTGTSGYVYDFENRLVQQAGISIVYDADGNRVSKTTANGTTQYLVDDLNPTGYAQVVDEVQSSAVVRTYSWGLELISQILPAGSPLATNHSPLSYYVFDGHGSVRALTNSAGAVTDTYDYDAFGILTHSTGTTPNNYLFAGEQFDPDLNLYYNRARYLNTSTGRFWTADTYEGDPESPLSLHRYLFAEDDPANSLDHSGHEIDELVGAVLVYTGLGALSGLAITHTFKGFLLGAAGGGALGVACTLAELCVRSSVSGVLNVVFQSAANIYENYYDRTLGLPGPGRQKQLELLVAAFAAGAASPLVSQFVTDPDDLARLAAIQSAFNATYKAFLQGKTFQQAFVQGVESALIAYVVQVGVDREFGPQFYTPRVVDFIIGQVRATISSTISTIISPIQENILRLDPAIHRFIYGN
jgi:RHS repeat-associated protein